MGGKRRTVIKIETHRLTVVHSRRRAANACCQRCGSQVRLLTPEEAAALAGVSTRAIYRRVECGDLHFVETAEGALLICSGSL